MKIAKYQAIKQALEKELISGKFENGDKFYTESELATRFNVSSITVIRALNELVKDGYIIRQQGRGSFVSRSRKHKLVQFSDIEVFPLQSDTVSVHSIERNNYPDILQKLNLRPNDFYYCIERIRYAKGIPYLYQRSYLPEQFINPHYTDKSYYSSIYRRLLLDFDIHMANEASVETNEIVLPAPPSVRELLNTPETEPCVLQVRTTTLRSTNKVIEYIESYKKWNFYKFMIET